MKKIILYIGIIIISSLCFAETIEEEIKEIITPRCGDGVCDENENQLSCSKDCGQFDIMEFGEYPWAMQYMVYFLIIFLIYKIGKKKKK